MQSKLNPYINFDGTAKAAAEFYKSIFGGELTLSTYGESGMNQYPEEAPKVMHAQLTSNNGMTLMLSDTPKGMPYAVGTNVSVSLSGDDEAELKGYWDKLTDGAKVNVPLDKAPWGDMFGMLTDKYGINWLVNIAPKKA